MVAATGADTLAVGLLRALPDAALFVTTTGEILAANSAAAALFGVPPAELQHARLADLVADAPSDVARYLDSCARTRSPLPGALRPRPAAPSAATGEAALGSASSHQSGRRTVACGVVRTATPDAPAVLLLRVRAGNGASDQFALLNRQLDDLMREVRARRAAEDALRVANARLHEQSLEVELANQQLQEQALELELQIEQARAFADELWQANDRLSAAAAAADGARTLAEQANKAKGDFLAVMSHELRTPLNAIGGYAELLELGVRGPVSDEQRQDIARIQRSQRHLLALIDDVLNFARLEAGQVHYRRTALVVDALLHGLGGLIAPQVRAGGLSYTYVGAPSSLVIHTDPERLQQVLLNLLANAVKFTPRGGAISLTCVLTGEAAGTRVRILVQDTGVGIAAEKLGRIFEPFVQLDQSLTRSHEGVGLGLAISRDLIRGLGGDLTAESAPGQGSIFTVTLPTDD